MNISKTSAFYRALWLPFFLIMLLISCSKDAITVLPTDKAIVSFTLVKANGNVLDTSTVSASISGDSVNVTVPPGTDLTSLTPIIKIEGVSISPASGLAQDFSKPVTYTVTGADGTTQTYIITVQWSKLHNLVFFGSSDNNFYALDAETGLQVWKYTGTQGFSYSSPTVWNNTVYAGSVDGNLYAFDAATGHVLWKFAANESLESSPAVAGSIVYFGSDDDYFYAVDATNGQLKWKYKTGFNVGSSPTVVNGTVYVGSDDHNMYAFDATSGEVKWTFTANDLFNSSSPVFENGTLFIGSRDGNLYAIDATSGALKWKYYTGGISLEMSSPTVSKGIVYIGGWYNFGNFSIAGSLYAVNEQTGTALWTSLNNLGIGSSPVVDGVNLYITTDDLNIYSVNAATGIINWKTQILPNGSSVAVANGTVYAGGGGTGFFYALDAASGTIKWKFVIGYDGIFTSSPCIIGTDGKIYHPGVSGEEF